MIQGKYMNIRHLHKLLNRFAIIACFVTIFSCTDENIIRQDGEVKPGQDVTVRLGFDVSVPEEKASSRVPDDNVVFDLYVLIFDANGNKTGSGYFDDLNNGNTTSQPNTTGSDNYVTIDTKTGPSYVYGIANISGATNVYEDDDFRSKLDDIQNKEELLNLSPVLYEQIDRVGNSYIMSGMAISDERDNTYLIEEGQDIKTLKLRRLDSHITFNIKAAAGCTFRPTSYQVFNVPKKVYLIEREASREIALANTWDGTNDEDEDDFFDTQEVTGTLSTDMSFNFWMVENRQNGKRSIPDNDYNQREKEEKNSNVSDSKPTVSNGDYVYAPDKGTYVVLKGDFTGNSTVEGNEGAVEASVSYTIHLGYVDQNADDFFSNRNTKYTYNITVSGVNNIIVEVLADDPEIEPSPGAEGDVIFTNGTTKYILDAHYETVLLSFSEKLLSGGVNVSDFFSYKISTPFASYISTDENIEVRDEDWLRFVRNEKDGNGIYSKRFQPYALSDGTRNGMTLSQFMEELKKIANGTEQDAYDNEEKVVYTCHINEFYYDKAPQGVTVSGDLWKRFVNVSPREVQILNDVELSPDGESSITKSTYILSQRSIQTFFSRSVQESYSAYGVETINETGPLYTWAYYPNQVGVTATDRDTGWDNFWKMIDKLCNTNKEWNTYVDFGINGYADVTNMQTVNAMKSDYQRAYLACMQRNRDLNGDGFIEKNEIQWYLPAINQYVGMFIGDGSLSEEAKLYTETDYVYKHYVSSTTYGNYPIIYWAEESVSESHGTEYNMAEYRSDDGTFQYTNYDHGDDDYYDKEGNRIDRDKLVNHYRCMRNLGSGTPVGIYSKDPNDPSITVPYLDESSTRPRVRYGELGTHKSDESESELYSGGFTYSDEWIRNNSYVNNYYVDAIDIRDIMDNTSTPCRYLTPRGAWRAPNLRELYLMSIVGALDDGVPEENAVSRTEFKFSDKKLPNSSSQKRIGWFYNGSNLTMGKGNENEGDRIRCVRDN